METSNPLYIFSVIFYVIAIILFSYCLYSNEIIYLYMGLMCIFISIIIICPFLIEIFTDSEYEDIIKEKLKDINKKED